MKKEIEILQQEAFKQFFTKDFKITTKKEILLIKKGEKVIVNRRNGKITLFIIAGYLQIEGFDKDSLISKYKTSEMKPMTLAYPNNGEKFILTAKKETTVLLFYFHKKRR